MVAKIVLIALSCVFIVQGQEDTGVVPPEARSQNEFTNVTASKTINAILRHMRIIMTDPVSTSMVRHIATAARILLMDPIGQKNVQNFIDFIVGLLTDPGTFVTIQTFHRRLVQLAAAGQSAPIALETVVVSTGRFLNEPQLMKATEGFVEGINIMLDGMTVTKLRNGINRVKSMTKLASLFKPIVGIELPKLQKRKRSDSNKSSKYLYKSTDEEVLQSRDLSCVNNLALTDNKDSVTLSV